MSITKQTAWPLHTGASSSAVHAGPVTHRRLFVLALMAGAFLRWPLRHPRWAVLVVLGCTAGVVLEMAALVLGALAALAGPAAVSAAWSTLAPVGHERWCAGPWRRLCWRVWRRWAWSHLTEALGLGRSVTVTTRDRSTGLKGTAKRWRPARCRVRTTPLGMTLDVRTPLGMSVDQVLDAGPAIASAAAASSVRVRRISPALARFELTMVDALSLPRTSGEPAGTAAVVLGRCEDGTAYTYDPVRDAHGLWQGMTRSGKSSTCYTFLGALAHRADVLVTGVDPSGVLLGPWATSRGARWIATGTEDLTRAGAALSGLVVEMDRRIAALYAAGRDQLTDFDAATPVLVVVLEEWPGLLSAARSEDAAAGRSGAERFTPTLERCAGRLVKEGAKVGVRVHVLAQRMSAKAIDTDDRANFAHRSTLRVDTTEAIRMLHDGAENLAREVREFAPGQALVEAPGVPFQRARFDLTTYPAYRRRVQQGLALFPPRLLPPAGGPPVPTPVTIPTQRTPSSRPVYVIDDAEPVSTSQGPALQTAPVLLDDVQVDDVQRAAEPPSAPRRPRQPKRPRQAPPG